MTEEEIRAIVRDEIAKAETKVTVSLRGPALTDDQIKRAFDRAAKRLV